MLDKTEFYTTRYCKIYRRVEVNDGKGCNVRQGHGRLCPLLGTNPLRDHEPSPTYSDSALGGILAVPIDSGTTRVVCHPGLGIMFFLHTTPEDDPEPYTYCGPAKAQPKPCFNPYRDVLLVLCRPCDGHRFSVWLGHAISTVELSAGSNYGSFVGEWWTPMCSKKEPKSLVAREYWTRQWTPEVTHAKRISVTTVLYSHRMPLHKDKVPPKTHLIPEALVAMALANFAASGAIVEDKVGTNSEE